MPNNPIDTYLRALADPTSLVDKAKIKKLEAQLAKSRSPLTRVKLRAQIAELERGDLQRAEDAFVAAAAAWAEEQGITPADAREAFAAEGVPKQVLDRVWAPKRGSKATSKARKRVSREDVMAAIPPKGEVFTLADVQATSGASYQTVRAVVEEMVEGNQLKEHGPDPSYTKRGKKPYLYERRR